MRWLLILGLSVASLHADEPSGPEPLDDVVVYGDSSAAVVAAIAAARAGKSVLIIEESPVLGGARSSGVLRLDDQYVESNSGVIEEF